MKKSPHVLDGHCPDCNGSRKSEIVADYCDHESYDHGTIWFRVFYRVMKCCGCGAVFIQKEEIFSEDKTVIEDPITGEYESHIPSKIEHWPAPTVRDRPEWWYRLSQLDDQLSSLMVEVYSALDNGLRVVAAIGIRTTFDRASELLGINTNLTFREKLDELGSQGKIGASEIEVMAVLIDAGSAAAHRGWKPNSDDLESMISILEAFLYRTLILPDEARRLKSSVPDRSKK